MALSPNNPSIMADLGWLYAISGRRREALNIISQLETLSKERYVSSFNLAKIYIGLGDDENSFDLLEKAYNERSDKLVLLKIDPAFSRISSDSRYTTLLERIGLSR